MSVPVLFLPAALGGKQKALVVTPLGLRARLSRPWRSREAVMMEWLSKNWIWVVLAIGVWLMFRRGGLGRMGHRPYYAGAMRGEDNMADSDGRAKDPVSGELVSVVGALNSTYQGRIYYFSSRENRDKFEAAPAQYASAPAAESHRHRGHGCC